MGRRKKEAAQMGKALIKDRFRGKKPVRGGESFLHTTDLNDTSDWGTLNLQSVTEQTSLDDFLTTAELAGRDFTAEKENIRLITPDPNSGRLSSDKMKKIQAAQEVHKNLLRIPRRPPWNEFTPADKLKEDEHISFLEWRRQLARLQEEDHIVITPYEKNLEFWRQLWRVIERSDVVVQIVDARNPLLFWCPDLDKYVKEVDPNKQTLLLINKADFLTAQQRQAWADYFRSQGMRAVFWSAMEEAARVKESESDPSSEQPKHLSVEDDNSSDDDDDDLDKSADNDVSKRTDNDANIYISDERHGENADAGGGESTLEVEESESVDDDDDDDDDSDNYETVEEYTDDEGNLELVELGIESKENRREQHRESYKYAETEESTVLSQEISTHTQNSDELLELFRKTAKTHYTAGVTTVGMVGYPNVGKSSTINAILQTKKVPVSATPGRTKHFQTLYVDKDLMLCDCPGLVFPSFVNTKAELVVNGILSIDQLMDSESPVALVCERIGRTAFEGVYHINLPAPEKGEDCKKPPNAYDVLHAYGLLRGFMSHKGNPDRPRAARYILKDFVNGKLLFCHPPPGIDPLVFQQSPYAEPKVYKIPSKANQQKSTTEVKSEALDKEFFAQIRVKAHAQGPHAVGNYVRTEGLKQIGSSQGESDTSGSQASVVGKPWKRHNNHNKKEKLRRIYAEHDCH